MRMSDASGGPHVASVEPVPIGCMTLYPVPESVARARRWFRKFITPHELTCSVDDCVLMFSELVANAISFTARRKSPGGCAWSGGVWGSRCGWTCTIPGSRPRSGCGAPTLTTRMGGAFA
jgi:hypothetical protein